MTPADAQTIAAQLLPPDLARRLEPLELGSRLRRAGKLRGDRRSTKRGSSVEFADYRNYTPGDDLRRVDWNLYARTDKLFLKIYEEEEDRAVHLLIDASASMGFGSPTKLETAQRLAAALGYVALNGLDRLQLVQLGGAGGFRPLRGRPATPMLLENLGGLQPGGAPALNRVLSYYAGRARQPGLLILISDLLDPDGIGRGLRALSARGHEVAVVHVLTAEELEPELSGDLELLDAESGHKQPLTLDRAALEAYARRLEAWLTEVRTACASANASYTLIRTETAIEEAIFGQLRVAQVLVS